MNNPLYTRLDGLDRNAPYIWRLAITAAEFQALAADIRSQDKSALLSGEWALRTVVYLAEWYKRSYDGGASQPVIELTSSELETLWVNSGLNQSANLYTQENGSRSWRYSLYVLGGLAVPFELGKKDTRYLKELCKLYHGESDRLDNLDEADRAAAFRQSISKRGSLYEYLRSILNGEIPFASEDLKNPNSDVNRFLLRIRNANDEVLRSKFRVEWRVHFSPDSPWMTRSLMLHLKPEEAGGGLQQYLRFDRVLLWGIAHPEKKKRLRICLRFLQDKKVVVPANPQKPIITYSNTGCHETGFLAWGIQKFAVVPQIPAEPFNALEIIVAEDDGTEHVAENIPVCEWMQLFRVSSYEDEWSSSQQFQQHESVLLCPNVCKILDVAENEVIYHPVFREQPGRESQSYYWRYIHEFVRFTDSAGHEHTLFNRQGYDQITAKLHSDVLRYSSAGTVKYLEWDDDLNDDAESQVPLLFHKKDLVIRHFKTRNDPEDTQCEVETSPEKLEFKLNGNYVEWTGDNGPQPGFLKLRVTVKGRESLYSAYYLPIKIKRDFLHCRILVGDKVYQDNIPMDGKPLAPTITFEEGCAEAKVCVEVWRPVLHKELIRNGVVAQYVKASGKAVLPYLLKDDVKIQDFNRDGFREYDCRNLSSIYSLPDFTPDGNAHLAALQDSRTVPATFLDLYAPEWLEICLSVPLDKKAEKAEFYHWNYFKDENPQPTKIAPRCPENEIIFCGMKDASALTVYPYVQGDSNPWEYQEDKISAVRCFEIAAEYRLYFFAMLPLRELTDYVNGLYQPLLKQHNGQLSQEDRSELKRFAEEFGLTWNDYEITLE